MVRYHWQYHRFSAQFSMSEASFTLHVFCDVSCLFLFFSGYRAPTLIAWILLFLGAGFIFVYFRPFRFFPNEIHINFNFTVIFLSSVSLPDSLFRGRMVMRINRFWWRDFSLYYRCSQIHDLSYSKLNRLRVFWCFSRCLFIQCCQGFHQPWTIVYEPSQFTIFIRYMNSSQEWQSFDCTTLINSRLLRISLVQFLNISSYCNVPCRRKRR